jgi:Uma2 family endonuclease
MANTSSAIKDNYTWSDYCSWPDNERWEIIGGESFAMAPVPGLRHQSIVVNLSAQLHAQFTGKKCVPFVAPTDVKLSEMDVVQPDLLVVCDEKQMKPTHIEGAPALIIEILSPSTMFYDKGRKMNLYAASGVKEVWLITPHPAVAEIYILKDGSYRLKRVFGRDDILTSPSFQELKLELKPVFDFPLEPEEQNIYVIKEGPKTYRTPRDG